VKLSLHSRPFHSNFVIIYLESFLFRAVRFLRDTHGHLRDAIDEHHSNGRSEVHLPIGRTGLHRTQEASHKAMDHGLQNFRQYSRVRYLLFETSLARRRFTITTPNISEGISRLGIQYRYLMKLSQLHTETEEFIILSYVTI
jgi:hypothetical protein